MKSCFILKGPQPPVEATEGRSTVNKNTSNHKPMEGTLVNIVSQSLQGLDLLARLHGKFDLDPVLRSVTSSPFRSFSERLRTFSGDHVFFGYHNFAFLHYSVHSVHDSVLIIFRSSVPESSPDLFVFRATINYPYSELWLTIALLSIFILVANN